MKRHLKGRSLIEVTMIDPGTGLFKNVSVDDAKNYIRYGWRYATYDECFEESKKRKKHENFNR